MYKGVDQLKLKYNIQLVNKLVTLISHIKYTFPSYQSVRLIFCWPERPQVLLVRKIYRSYSAIRRAVFSRKICLSVASLC